MRAAAVGSKHWVGTWLLGKIADQAVPDAMGAPPSAATAFAHPGRLPSAVARKLSVNVPAKVLCGPEGPCEKSPFRSALVGIVTRSEEMPCTIWRSSTEAKKKVLFFLMGPPNVPPNWFWWKSGLMLSKKPRASRTVLRKNSYASPWNSLVPPLVTTLTTEPELRPYSASKVLVSTRNSSMVSGDGSIAGTETNWSLASPPFTLKLLARPRPPFTDTTPAFSLPANKE